MSKSICIFEDGLFSQLYPLTLTRPVFDLRCGILSLKEKIVRRFPQYSVHLLCRDYLRDVIQEQNPNETINELRSESTEYCLFINGRILFDSEILKKLDMETERIYVDRGKVIAALLRRANIARISLNKQNIVDFENIKNVDTVEIGANLISYPWDLVSNNSQQIESDFGYLNRTGKNLGYVSKHAILLSIQNITIDEKSHIKPGVVLDAEAGPIVIGSNVTIMSNAVIEGPAFVGDNSILKIGAKIYEGTSIGECCKVGGEVEESIIHSHSNKQHDGFLGHSCLGSWVNIGAGTNNSDLKNNYGSVSVFVDGKWLDSGSRFVGLFMGDHSKSGINTMFNTGTVVGAMSNIYGGGFPPKNIPSFAWGGKDGFAEHDLEKALETAKIVMARRNVKVTSSYEKMIRHVFESTKAEREALSIKPSKT